VQSGLELEILHLSLFLAGVTDLTPIPGFVLCFSTASPVLGHACNSNLLNAFEFE
jgi:hypothetical protein